MMAAEQFEHEYNREYVSSEFYCPFCKKHSKKFLPFGLNVPVLKEKNVVRGGYRLNAMCPHCHSTDRERLVYLYLENKSGALFARNKRFKLLHVAPEKNLRKTLIAKPNIDYLSADLNSPSSMVKMDITDIKYDDNTFDVVICNHVLEHIPDDQKAMAELYRVLKPGGWAILQVPISLSLNQTYEDPLVTSPEERERIFGQSDHVRIYAKDYRDRLEEVGFFVEVYSFAKEFGDSAIRKYGLSKDENIYICSKPGLGENFEHKYGSEKLQIITPKKRDFPMLATPRLLTYFSQNAHEDFSSDLLLNLIKDDTLFIDVGAHYGYYTLLAGTKYPKCKIISIEPVPENCEILRQNIELNQLKNVKVHNIALSNKNETKRFNITEASECSGFHKHPLTKIHKVVELEAVTLDNLIKEIPKVPVIIKIDTEGHEICVLEGMEKILRNATDITLIVEFNPKCLRGAGYDPTDLLKNILQFGFDIYAIDDNKRMTYKLAQSNLEKWIDYLPDGNEMAYTNLLCIKKDKSLSVFNSSEKPLVSVYSSGSKGMKIAAVTMVYNEALLLPYFLHHYEHLDEIYVLYETDSTDDTLKILKQASNVIIKNCHIEGGLDSIDKVNLTNDTLHTIKADWVYVVDCDEFIFPPQESPEDFLIRQDCDNYNVVRAGMFQVYRHRTDKDLDPSLLPIPQRVHGDPDLFSTVEGPNKARNTLYVKPIVVKPSNQIRFWPGNHFVEGNVRVSPELYMGAHWQMADPSLAIDRRIKNKMRISERNKKLGMGWHYQNVTEEWIRAECDRHLDDPIIDELYLYSDKSFKNYDSFMRSKANMKNLNPWNHLICFVVPNRITLHSAWHEHIPFAMFLIDLLRPKTIVELGTYYGDSYCAFCQAVKELHLNTACYAVDTWKGDPHSGIYGPEILADLRAHHDPLYSSFSRLIQSTFDEALKHFDNGSIDLLHIDGYHTYESVRHDFEAWLPKMSSYGVVLLHDINVREQDFGIRKFWNEVKLKYPHFEFLHGHGLGVLVVSKVRSKELQELFKLPEEESIRIRDFFFQLGHQFTTIVRNKAMAYELENQKRQLQELKADLESKDAQIQQIQQSIPMQLVNRYQKVINKLLPPSTRRRRPYELMLSSIRVILNEGWKGFFREVRAYLLSKRDSASKQQ